MISPPTVGRMLDISCVRVNLELYICSYFGWSQKNMSDTASFRSCVYFVAWIESPC